jgi:hypothetical protein
MHVEGQLTSELLEVDIDPQVTDPLLVRHPAELLVFARALASKMTGTKFGLHRASSSNLFVYVEGDTFCMGQILYGDFTDERPSSERYKYGVISRHVSNERYLEADYRYNMKSTQNIAKALSLACRFFRRFSVSECASEFLPKLSNEINGRYWALDKEVEETTTAVFGTRFHMDKLTTSPIMAEMRWLNMRGHQFSEPDLNSKVAALIAKFDELIVLKKARKNFLFAQAVATPSGETIISTCHVQTNGHGTEIHGDYNSLGTWVGTPVPHTYVEGEVPEELVAKLAVLSMCEIGQYVSNVGMRVLGNACFAEITEEEYFD